MSDSTLLYVGTYTNSDFSGESERDEGIYIYQFDQTSGALTELDRVGGIVNPSYLAVDNDKRCLYAVSEVLEESASVVTAYTIDPETGALTHLNHKVALGKISAYVSLDQTSRMVLVSNYGGGDAVVAFPIGEDGALMPASSTHKHTDAPSGVVAHRQEASHPHCIDTDPTNTFALACDLGLDQVIVYRLDAENHTLSNQSPAYKTAPGAGPRHLKFHPTLNRVYVLNELNSTVSVLLLDRETGTLTEQQTLSTLPDDFTEHNQCSGLHITPDGRYLYGANRGHDSLAIYAVDETTGALTIVGHQTTKGDTPRGFAIDPSGKFVIVANQESDTIVVFRIDQNTGLLEDTGVMVTCPKPACVKVL